MSERRLTACTPFGPAPLFYGAPPTEGGDPRCDKWPQSAQPAESQGQSEAKEL